MSQKHELSPDSAAEAGPVVNKTHVSDDIDLPLAASILYECWTEGRKMHSGDEYPLAREFAKQLTIEPSSDIRVPVDGDQDRIYVTGLVKSRVFSYILKNNVFDVFWAWTPSKREEKVWMSDYVGYAVSDKKRTVAQPLIDAACKYKNMIVIAMRDHAEGGNMHRRLWGAGLCMCPDTHRFFTVTGEVYVTVVVRDSVAKKLNDDCPGSFVPFHAN